MISLGKIKFTKEHRGQSIDGLGINEFWKGSFVKLGVVLTYCMRWPAFEKGAMPVCDINTPTATFIWVLATCLPPLFLHHNFSVLPLFIFWFDTDTPHAPSLLPFHSFHFKIAFLSSRCNFVLPSNICDFKTPNS